MNRFFDYFLKISSICLGLLLLAAAGEHILSSLPPGTVLTFLAFATAVTCLFCTFKNKPIRHRNFFESIALIAISDLLFYLVNYYQALRPQLATITLVSTFIYALGFIRASQAFISSTSWKLKRDAKKLVIPTLIIGFTFLYYFLPSLLKVSHETHSTLMWLALGTNLLANLAISIIALTTLIYSMNPLLSVVALGYSMLPLVNFAISYEINLNGAIAFGFYEYCWAAGLLLIEVSLIQESLHRQTPADNSLDSPRSIAVRYKATLITTTSALLLLSPLIGGAGLSIRFVVLALISSMLISMLISSFTVAAVTHYSEILGLYLEKGFTRSTDAESSLLKLPIEIETLFSSVFAQSMLQQQERQIRLLRDRELHQKFAHDVRSPIQALGHLLQRAQFASEEERFACQSALRTMSRSSEEILGYLAPAASKIIGSQPASQVVDCLMRSQSIFKSAYPQTALSIRLEIQTSNPYAWIDELVLERLFLNLIQNAVEAPGATKLVITLRNCAEPGSSSLELDFTDNGSGASPADILSLNQSSVFTRKEHGHGIGMSTQASSLKPFGASIRFSSVEKKSFTAKVSVQSASPSIVLIEDDRAVQLAWHALAAQKNITIELLRLEELAELEVRLQDCDRQTEIYVDYHLGNGSGVPILKRLKKMGFERLYLATSADLSEADHSDWNIRDKTFPR